MIKKSKKPEPFVRINSRVPKAQFQFVKDQAKKQKKTEGEIHRLIVEFYMLNHKK